MNDQCRPPGRTPVRQQRLGGARSRGREGEDLGVPGPKKPSQLVMTLGDSPPEVGRPGIGNILRAGGEDVGLDFPGKTNSFIAAG